MLMKIYNIPPNTNEKEKVIGGVLTLNQFFWIVGGIGLGSIIFFTLFKFIGAVPAALIALIFAVSGIPFALYKKNELTLFKYIILKRTFKKKQKKLPNKRKNNDLLDYFNNI